MKQPQVTELKSSLGRGCFAIILATHAFFFFFFKLSRSDVRGQIILDRRLFSLEECIPAPAIKVRQQSQSCLAKPTGPSPALKGAGLLPTAKAHSLSLTLQVWTVLQFAGRTNPAG